jgi:nitrate reductase gamma subunit
VSGYAYFVGGVLPYLAVAVFVIGMAYRFKIWFTTKQPGKMYLNTSQEPTLVKGVLAEAIFFPSLFRGDRVLWAMAWFFHATLALVFVGHFRVVTGLLDTMMLSMGMNAAQIDQMSSTSGGVAGALLLATGILLFVRRLTIPRVRDISGPPDFFALLLLIAIISTGNAMRLGAHFDLSLTREWVTSLLAFSTPVVPQNDMFLLHALLGFSLFMYIPFSKILHFGGIFFTQALIKRS